MDLRGRPEAPAGPLAREPGAPGLRDLTAVQLTQGGLVGGGVVAKEANE